MRSGIVQMMGMMQGFNPSTISPTLFINPYVNPYVTSVDNNGVRQRGNIIDSATATTGQALATAGTLGSKPIYNGEGWYFESGAQMSINSATDYNFIHDGSDFDLWTTFFICPPATTTYFRSILSNNGVSNTGRGISINLNSTAGNNQLTVRVGNGTTAFISFTLNSLVTVNGTNSIRLTRSGSTARVFINGVLQGTQTISLSPGVGGSFDFMRFCSTAASSANLYIKDVVIFNRALTTAEATSMNSRRFQSIVPTPTNVYLFIGDSNCAGRGINASIAGDLTGTILGVSMARFNANLPDTTTWMGKLLLGTNQTLISENVATNHGAEMRFGKEMGATKDLYILKYGRGSHSAFPRGGVNPPDFNPNSAPSGAYGSLINSAIPRALEDLVHSQRRSPVFRGLIIILGANDAIFGKQGNSWIRTGTSATISSSFHGLVVGGTLGIYNSNDLTAIPNEVYTITSATTNNFTITVPNAGATSGTVSYSGAYKFKQNVYDIINGLITTLTGSTYRNQVTNGLGYTVDKLRIFLPRPTNPVGALNAEAYSQLITASTSVGTDFLIDNPSRVGNVLESTSQSTNGFGMLDGLHYSNSGYSDIGINMKDYYLPFINE